MRAESGPGARGSRGFALIVVLWFLVLIAAIGMYLMVNARTEAAIARNIRAAANAEALADAGIAQAAFNLTDTVVSNRWKLDGEPHTLSLRDGKITIRLSDETAKINPNHASDVLMAALFETVGVDRSLARHLGAAVADWVGMDDMPRPLGAKLPQYQHAGLGYGPPNAPIETLDELQLVLGMTPTIFAAVRPYLTIYTDSDPQNASPPVQRALLLAAQETRAADAAEAASSGGDSDLAGSDSTDESAAGSGAPANAAAPDAPKEPQLVVEVDVTAESNGGGTYLRHAVLRLDSANPKGYDVLAWTRPELAE